MINPAKALYEQRKANGLCVKCGRPRDPKYVVCARCHRAYQYSKVPNDPQSNGLTEQATTYTNPSGVSVYVVPPGFTGENLSAFKKQLREKSRNGHAVRWGKPKDA